MTDTEQAFKQIATRNFARTDDPSIREVTRQFDFFVVERRQDLTERAYSLINSIEENPHLFLDALAAEWSIELKPAPPPKGTQHKITFDAPANTQKDYAPIVAALNAARADEKSSLSPAHAAAISWLAALTAITAARLIPYFRATAETVSPAASHASMSQRCCGVASDAQDYRIDGCNRAKWRTAPRFDQLRGLGKFLPPTLLAPRSSGRQTLRCRVDVDGTSGRLCFSCPRASRALREAAIADLLDASVGTSETRSGTTLPGATVATPATRASVAKTPASATARVRRGSEGVVVWHPAQLLRADVAVRLASAPSMRKGFSGIVSATPSVGGSCLQLRVLRGVGAERRGGERMVEERSQRGVAAALDSLPAIGPVCLR